MITAALIVLAVLAYLGRSLVMLASVFGMAVALWLARGSGMRGRLLGLILGSLTATVLAEVIHLLNHLRDPVPPDHGGFWVSAILVGLINVAAMTPVLAAERWRKRRPTHGEAVP